MKIHFTIFLTIIFSVLLAIVSCKDNSLQDVVESIESAEDNSLTENEFSAVFDYANTEGSESEVINGAQIKTPKDNATQGLRTECMDVKLDTATKTLNIDFGSQNCLCKDGRYRRGKIIATFSGKWKDVGSSVDITLEDYYVQDINISGNKTITRLGDNKWQVVVTDAAAVTEKGTITWECNRTVERIEGSDTPLNIFDDFYKYEGSASGINRRGINFSVTIDKPLIKEISFGCYKNFTDGKWTITNEGGATMSLDYYPIDGNCDKFADITINGKTKRITLR